MPADFGCKLEDVQKRIAKACSRANRTTDEVTLIAVTKKVTPDIIEKAFHLGVRDFGENHVQEAEKKAAFFSSLLPRPALHMIGHLQSNKVKFALGLFDIIHSVDSLKLALTIDRLAVRQIPVLLEVNVAGEPNKNGFSLNEIGSGLTAITKLNKIKVIGLMTVAPIVDDAELVRPIFRKLRELRDAFNLKHLSMGMTGDFEVAIEEGATMIRLGRAIFGDRE